MTKNKLDIDGELEELIEKYDLDRHYPAYRVSRRACDYIHKWIMKLSAQDKMFLFIGMDEYALKMIDGWREESENINILLVDSVEKLGDFNGKLKRADEIYIISYTRTIEILHWLWERGYQAKSVYDILENKHIYLQMEFYRFFTPLKINPELGLSGYRQEKSVDGTSLTIYEYYYQKQRLLHGADNNEDRKRITEKLFFLAVCMRNFLEAEKILHTMDGAVEYEQCWDEIKCLFGRIKRTLSLREENSIVIYWLDALPYEESEKFEYLQSRRKHSLYFHNAYTVSPNTNAVCKSMFCGIQQVDDLGYKVRHVDLDNSPLLREIIEQECHFQIISGYLNKLFAAKFRPCTNIALKDSCSKLFWNLICQMLLSEQRTVYLVHAFTELHDPLLCVRRDRFEKKYDEESRESLIDELDEQLHFYDDLLGNEFYRIYMSDHGKGGSGENIRRKNHIHFQVYHASWKGRETKKLFCFLDFSQIIYQLLRKGEIDDSTWNREYVPIQDVDYYNKNDLNTFYEKRMIKGLDFSFYTAYKGVITDEGVYYHFKTGEELYDKWSEGVDGLPIFLNDRKKDSEIIRELRKKAGEFPKELDSDLKFRYSAYTYKIYRNIKKTIREASRLLNERLATYADGSIMLRMGGEHSRQLYEILTETGRRKIGGILDKHEQCRCRELGLRIFKLEEQLPNKVEAVLLSSYIFLDELRTEVKELYNGLEIIDIYQYWREKGIDFQRDFWFGCETDYEVGFPED